MNLVVQLLACTGAVLLVAIVVHGDANRTAIASATAATAAVVVALLGAQGLYATAKSQYDNGKAQRALPRSTVLSAGSQGNGVDGKFIEFAVGQMRRGDTFALQPGDPTVFSWLAYRALPRVAAARVQDASVIVFYGTTPRQQGYRPSQLTDVRRFGPNLFVARRVGKATP